MPHMVTEQTFWPSGASHTNSDDWHFLVKVTWRGDGRYSVDHLGAQLSRAGNWYAGVPAFKRHQYRFTYDEAMGWAAKVVEILTVNGKTWVQWQTFFANQAKERAK